MSKILTVLAGVLVLLALGTTAQAIPAPAPAPKPYTLDQEIVTETVRSVATDTYYPDGPTGKQYTIWTYPNDRAAVACPAGKVVTGGGSREQNTYPLSASTWGTEFPGQDEPGNGVEDGRHVGEEDAVTVHAVCVNAAAPTG